MRTPPLLLVVALSSVLWFPPGGLADHPTLSLDKGNAGPITAISAVPLEAGHYGLTLQLQWIGNDELSDQELEFFSSRESGIHSVSSVSSISLAAAYGATDDLTLGFSLPRINRQSIRELHHHDDGAVEMDPDEDEPNHENTVEQLGNSSGLGDLTLYGQYRFWHDAVTDTNAAWIFGLRAPTGSTSEHASDGALFETEHQPGSGAWDVLGGLAYSTRRDGLGVTANVLHTFAGNGSQATNLGDIFNYNLAFAWRLDAHAEPVHEHPGGSHHDHSGAAWDLVLELNGDWREEVNVGGQRDRNTGGNIVYLSAGTRASWGHGWSASVAAGVPIISHLNGVQSDPDVRLLFGLGKGY